MTQAAVILAVAVTLVVCLMVARHLVSRKPHVPIEMRVVVMETVPRGGD